MSREEVGRIQAEFFEEVQPASNGPCVRFGMLLKNARKRAGMTQRQLADLSTVSVRAIRDLELERTRSPRTETIRLLADALRLSESRRAKWEWVAAGQGVSEPLIDELTAPPTPLGPIVGREHEVASLSGMVASGDHRLITVAGMPGVGKSRLVQEVASRLHHGGVIPVVCLASAEAWADGRAPIHSAETMVRRLAEPLGCRPTLDDLVSALADREILLTVDGRGLDRDADLALRLLLSRCPGVRVLYEARVRSLPFGDAVFPVSPLAVPEWGYGEDPVADLTAYSAVQLLRVHAARLPVGAVPDLAVSNAIAGICWCLDGNPALLRAAASWLLLDGASELLETAARFPLALVTSPSDVGDPLIAWLEQAVASLSRPEGEILRSLAESEPWTVEQAVDLLGGSVGALRAVHALRARGLVRRTDPLNRTRPRFTVLNLVRHFLWPAADGVRAVPPRPGPTPPKEGDRYSRLRIAADIADPGASSWATGPVRVV